MSHPLSEIPDSHGAPKKGEDASKSIDTNEEKEVFPISKSEYSALMDVRGLASGAHLMVMCAKGPNENGHYILKGTSDAFDELTSDLSDEIYYELSPKARIKCLARLYDRLTPAEDDEE